MVSTHRPVIEAGKGAAFIYIDGEFYWSTQGSHSEIIQFLRQKGYSRDQLQNNGFSAYIWNKSDDDVPDYVLEPYSDLLGMPQNYASYEEALTKLRALFHNFRVEQPYAGEVLPFQNTSATINHDIIESDNGEYVIAFTKYRNSVNMKEGFDRGYDDEGQPIWDAPVLHGPFIWPDSGFEPVIFVDWFGKEDDRVWNPDGNEVPNPYGAREVLQALKEMKMPVYATLENKGLQMMTPKVFTGSWVKGGDWTRTAGDGILQAMPAAHLIDRQIVADDAASAAIKALTQAGGHVYVVGGAVRDAMMNKSPKDIDLLCSGLELNDIENALTTTGGRVDITGKQFGVIRLRLGDGDVEVAMPRTEQSTGTGHKDFQVLADPHIPVETDLGRRDFTINAMAYHPQSQTITDPYGGADDLTNRRLVLVNPSAFEDDPLRIVRALVATARYGFEADPALVQAMQDSADKIRNLPGERIQMELDKLLSASDPVAAMTMAEQTGLLDWLAPELSSTVGFDQMNPHHDLHVWDHTMQALRKITALSNDPDLRLAVLFHDSGKPASFWRDPDAPAGGGGHFYKKTLPDGSSIGEDHEDVGADLAREFMKRLHYPNKRIERVETLIQNHMFPYFDSKRGARKFLKSVGGDEKLAFDLLLVREADASGKTSGEMNDFDASEVIKARNLLQEVLDEGQATTGKDIAINGHDLLQLGLKPGPQIGQILNKLLEAVVDNPELNTKEQLIGLAERELSLL